MPPALIAVILGLIEGITEFLPVSSTGHLLIAERWLGERSEMFNVVIQPAAALALIPLFWTRLKELIFGLGERQNRDMLAKLLVAFGITGAGGLVMKKLGVTLPKEIAPIAWATLVGGLVIFVVEWMCKGKSLSSDITWPIAIAFGVAQLIAVGFPGASRSGTTIMLAMAMGLARPAATEFTFLLGIPTLFAAGAKELKDAIAEQPASIDWLSLGCGALASFVSAFVVVRWLIGYVRGHSFNGFGVYRVLLGALLLFWLASQPALSR